MKKRLLPRWVSEFRDRHKKPRLRFRKSGHPTYYFKSPFGTDDFAREYRACLDGKPAGIDRNKPGSVDDLIARYYRSQDFMSGSATTQSKNRGILEMFRAEYGPRSVAGIQFEHVDAILAKKAAQFPAAARNLRKQLRRLFAYAVKCRMRTDNPVEQTATIKAAKDAGFAPWSEDDVRQFQNHWPIGTTARLALELMLWTGNRRSDALKLGPQHIKSGAFHLVQQKTGKPMVIPIAPDLAEAILAMPKSDSPTLITTSYGKPFSSAGFGERMRKWCADAGLVGRSSHGLRKTIAQRMALAGIGNQGIKSVTGHSADSEVSLYTRGVDQQRLAKDTMQQLSDWKLANSPSRLAKQNAGGTE